MTEIEHKSVQLGRMWPKHNENEYSSSKLLLGAIQKLRNV